jgi:hypothetical protein
MKPRTARFVMALIVSLVAISGIVIVNSRYHGSFLIGVLLIVIPVLALSLLLPRILPVRCDRCGGRMHFYYRKGPHLQDLYSYQCEQCGARHEWEGSSSSHGMLDS